GVHDQAEVAEGDLLVDRLRRARGDQLLVLAALVVDDRALDPELLGHVAVRPPADEQLGPAVVEDVLEFGGGEPVVERYEHRAEQAEGEQRLRVGGVVDAEVGDPVAAPDAEAAEGVGEPVDPLGELGVGEVAAVAGECHLLRCHPGPPPGPGPDALIAHLLLLATRQPAPESGYLGGSASGTVSRIWEATRVASGRKRRYSSWQTRWARSAGPSGGR